MSLWEGAKWQLWDGDVIPMIWYTMIVRPSIVSFWPLLIISIWRWSSLWHGFAWMEKNPHRNFPGNAFFWSTGLLNVLEIWILGTFEHHTFIYRWWQLKYFWNVHPYLGKICTHFDLRIFFQVRLVKNHVNQLFASYKFRETSWNIWGLGGILKRSEKMLVLWDRSYIEILGFPKANVFFAKTDHKGWLFFFEKSFKRKMGENRKTSLRSWW